LSGLHGLLAAAAQQSPAVIALRDDSCEVDYASLARRVACVAGALAERGLVPGERVVILAKNRVEFVELYFALFALEAVAVPLNWRLRANEVQTLIEDAGARLVFSEGEFAPLLEGFAGQVVDFASAQADWTPFSALTGSATLLPKAESSAVAVQMYTSGTTGRAKGSMLSHANIDCMQRAWREDMPLVAETSRFLQVTPLFHVGAVLMMVSCVAARATLRLCPEFFSDHTLGVLRKEGITHALFVPAMMQWLLAEKGVDAGGFDALQLVVYGAAPMPPAVLELGLKVFGCEFLQGYGLTETAGVLTTLKPSDHLYDGEAEPPERLLSVGRAVSCCELRLVDGEGAEVSDGAVGEVVARGENIHLGYAGDNESTWDDHGWFHTGDLGRFDADGYLYLVDRVKDMICVAGENVFPREIEMRLLEHQAVQDVAVIGVPHHLWGEEVLALVVRVPESDPSAPALIQHCRGALARFKCPTRLEWVEKIPRNAAGKISKVSLRGPYWRGHDRRI